MALIQIPSEIRQIILDLAISSQVVPPESPSVTQHDRARLNQNVFGGSAIWQRAPKNPALPLMLVNKQLYEEVQKVLQFAGTDYHVDIMYVKDRGLWTTWSIPALPKTQYIDSIHATFRIFDPPADLDKKFNNSLSFRGGDGGPPFAVWGFYSLLAEALRSGPGYLQPPESQNPSCRFAVKKIVVNILAPTDCAMHKSINRSDADFDNKGLQYRTLHVLRHDDVEKPPEDRLAEYMEQIFRTVWCMGYHSLNYGAVILEGVRDSIDFLVNGQLQTRFDLAKRVEVMETNKPYWGETPELVQKRMQNYETWLTWLKERRKKMEEGLEFDIQRPVGDII